MKTFRFEIGTHGELVIADVGVGEAAEKDICSLKLDIINMLLSIRGACANCIEEHIQQLAGCYEITIEGIKVSVISWLEFDIEYINNILQDAKNGTLSCDADEIYIIMAATGNYDKKYAAFVGFNVIDEDTRLLRAAAQNINLRNGSHKFDFIFSNAYPTNDSGSLLDLELDSTTEIVIPIKAKSDYLYYVLLRLFYVRCVKRGIEEIKGVGQPLFSSKFSKYR